MPIYRVLMEMKPTTLLRRAATAPTATNAAADAAAAPASHPTLAAPVSPPTSPTLCYPAEFPPGFTPPRSGPRSQADPVRADLGPSDSQPRGSPASSFTIVLESPPVAAAPSAPCVGSRPARRVRFNVPVLPAAGMESKGACRPSGAHDTCGDAPWVLDWTLLPPPPPLSTRAMTNAVEVTAHASAPGSSGHALTSPPRPSSTVPASPAGNSMRAAPPPILPRPCGSSSMQLLQRAQPSSDAINLCSWRVVRPAHWWRKQAAFMPHQRQMCSPGQHSRQKREGATLRQKQRKVWKEVICYRCRGKGHYSYDCTDPVK
ncbi:hypothetical protein ZWY2020_037383 [Hordeum vulgare]|nr:hypothetical protein ZWY2020_037383 [Hordeum vulgare]